jgi:hypothetical protein
MTDEAVVAIARIPLARSATRMLAAPGLLLLAAGLAAGAGWIVSGLAGLGLMVAGGLLAVLALYLAAMVLSVRLEVEVSTLRVRRLGADQRFQLVRGAVTRVPLSGEGAAKLQARFGALGWGIGPARLRGEERIHLVRLAPTRSLILIPTDAGRVGIAPASEEQLIGALSAAARVQQRLDQVAARARSVPVARLVEEAPRPAPPPSREPEPGRVLTGIERVMLEERLAAERAAALAAAETERRRAEEEAARRAAMEALRPPPAEVPARPPRRMPSIALPRPRIALPSRGPVPRASLLRYAVAALPLLAAFGVWVAASLLGRMQLDEAEARLVGWTLALTGPGAALGALMARAWFPRLLGLVSLAALCCVVLVGRALLF